MQLLELSVCGGNGIGDREALGKIQTPQATRTHCPVDHKWLVDKVSNRLEENNLKILQEVHTTSHEGQRYFGLMQVQYLSLKIHHFTLIHLCLQEIIFIQLLLLYVRMHKQ